MLLKWQRAIAMGAPAQVVIKFTLIWSGPVAKLGVLPDDQEDKRAFLNQGLLFDMEKWYWNG